MKYPFRFELESLNQFNLGEGGSGPGPLFVLEEDGYL